MLKNFNFCHNHSVGDWLLGIVDCGLVMEKKIKSFRDLVIWQEGIELVKLIYKATESFPEKEKFGLISQIRRAAVSIPFVTQAFCLHLQCRRDVGATS